MKIAVEVQRMTKAGVAVNVIFDKVKEMVNGPRSLTTFYKIYRGDLISAKASTHEAVGSLIMEKILVGKDYRAMELFAKTKMGWNEKVVVEERGPDDADQDTSAVDDLIAALNLKKK
jgi:hypothetical protein